MQSGCMVFLLLLHNNYYGFPASILILSVHVTGLVCLRKAPPWHGTIQSNMVFLVFVNFNLCMLLLSFDLYFWHIIIVIYNEVHDLHHVYMHAHSKNKWVKLLGPMLVASIAHVLVS